MIVGYYINEPKPLNGAILLSIITIKDGKYYLGTDYTHELISDQLNEGISSRHIIQLPNPVELTDGHGLWLDSTGETKILPI